jgi:hypothetical protein
MFYFSVFGVPLIADVSEEEQMHLTYFFLNKALTEKEVIEENLLPSDDIKFVSKNLYGFLDIKFIIL